MTDDNLAREWEEREVRRVLIVSGGGDAPGLDAFLSAFVETATDLDLEVYGSEDAFHALLDEPSRVLKLTPASIRAILPASDAILGCAKLEDPFAYEIADSDGIEKVVDVSERIRAKLDDLEVDTLVLVGGEETMSVGIRLAKMGIPIVGIPQTIDSNLAVTDLTLGLDTAVTTATGTIDALRSMDGAQDRVMIVEVTGRDAGWNALLSGLAGSADVILIPEIPYDVDRVVDKIEALSSIDPNLSVIVIAAGAKPHGGTVSSISEAHESTSQRHAGAGSHLARLLGGRIERSIRVTELGHLQMRGSPSSFDRVLGTRFGVYAAELCGQDHPSWVVALRGQEVVSVPLEAAVANLRRVPPDGELVGVARAIGIELGQE